MDMKKILQILSFEGIAKKATEEKVKSNRKAKRERERETPYKEKLIWQEEKGILRFVKITASQKRKQKKI